MKKKKAKLSLKKDVISNLQAKSVTGGGTTSCMGMSCGTCTANPNSECGCITTGTDETMTCQLWGCPHDKLMAGN